MVVQAACRPIVEIKGQWQNSSNAAVTKISNTCEILVLSRSCSRAPYGEVSADRRGARPPGRLFDVELT